MSNSAANQTAPEEPFTTDLVFEPMASDGIRRCYCVNARPLAVGEKASAYATLEVMIETALAPQLSAEAERLGALHADEAVKCQLVTDDGGSSWCIVETLASRAVVIDLAAYADSMGCRRQPFPI